jgi:pimeloyl-ACP methyl ester carboxylesterase
MTDIQFLNGPHGEIAYQLVEGNNTLPPIIFLCGFKSDMGGSKAEWLHDYCVKNHRTYLRFDYFAHGKSDGDFKNYTIGKGVMDSIFTIERLIQRPAIIIGSSMGGWIGLRLMRFIPDKIHGFIGIAAAPDFTRKIYAQLDDGHLAQLNDNGYIEEDSGYDEPYTFTRELFDDGEIHCLLDTKIPFNGDVHLIQGKMDTSVDWNMPDAINHVFDGRAKITLIDDGDHSLSRPQDLDILQSTIKEMSA